MRERLRTVRFSPYRKGHGPTFTLATFDTGRQRGGKWTLAYCLTMRENGKSSVLFEGEDFGCSPCHAIDSDDAIRSLMGFLTLRHGDTDADYFENYTPEQLDYCTHHAEALACCVSDRFGED